jgi:hypothetical protein
MRSNAVPATGNENQQASKTTAPARAVRVVQQRVASIHTPKRVIQMVAR